MANSEIILTRLQDMSLEQLRQQYKSYLNTFDLSGNTVATASVNTFYLFKHEGHDAFWNAVLSPDFEQEARSVLHAALAQHSSANPDTQVSSYLSHLRRFRNYAFSMTGDEQYAVIMQARELQTAEKSKQSTRNAKISLPRPSISEVEYHLSVWDTLEDYSLQEQALDKLFFQLCPENTCIEDILLKVSSLNDFYSTNIYSTFPVAKHILALKIDGRLKTGDLSLVEEIQKVSIKESEINFYSFATKYCSHHNPLAFPIYDSYVDEVLFRFMQQDHFAKFYRYELKDYQRFYDILLTFRTFYGLEQYNLKEIDKYLWQLGKTHLPKDYGKKGKAAVED